MTQGKTIKLTLDNLRKLIKEAYDDIETANDNSAGEDDLVYPQELDSVPAREVAGIYLVHTRDLDDHLFPSDFGPWDEDDDEKEEHFKAWAKHHGGIYYVSNAFLRKDLDVELVGAAMEADVGLVVYR